MSKVEKKSRAILVFLSLSLWQLFVQKLPNTINSRPIIAEDQSRISSLSLSFYRNFLAFSSQLSIRTERAKEKREESDNGSLSHIIFSYEYFIQECKHTAREKEEKKEFQSSLRLFSSSECLLVFLSISNHWARCRQRKSHNVYSNKMKWTHTQKWQIHYIAFVSIILRTIHFHIDTLSDYTKKVLSIWKGGWGERKKIKEDEYDRKRFVF